MKASFSERRLILLHRFQRLGSSTPCPDKYYTFLIILTVRKLYVTSKLNSSLLHAVPRSKRQEKKKPGRSYQLSSYYLEQGIGSIAEWALEIEEMFACREVEGRNSQHKKPTSMQQQLGALGKARSGFHRYTISIQFHLQGIGIFAYKKAPKHDSQTCSLVSSHRNASVQISLYISD